MAFLILMRHGESVWNALNLFTGWVDVSLSPKGIEEAFLAGEQISHTPIDIVYTSTLIRGEMTALLALSKHKSGKTPIIEHKGEGRLDFWGHINSPKTKESTIPVIKAWQLNERMYGDLQGKNKQEMREEYGDDQVQIWRRSYNVAPPNGESLEMTAKRALPYFLETIVPMLESGKNVLISAHGNSLRAIMMHLDQLTEKEVVSLEIPTGKPIVYLYQNNSFEKKPPSCLPSST